MEQYLTVINILLFIFIAVMLYIIIKHNVVKEFLGSFNNKEEGMSGRKNTAFGFACLAAYAHYEGFRDRILSVTVNADKSITTLYTSYINQSNIVTVILIDVSVVLLALALIKVDDILKFKNGTTVIETKTETSATTTTPAV